MKGKKHKSLVGRKFARLKVVRLASRQLRVVRKSGHRYRSYIYQCRCDCGQKVKVRSISLTRANQPQLSCGCYQREIATKKSGLARRKAPGEHNRNSLIRFYKYGAKKRNLQWELTVEEFEILTKQNCHYCGVPPRQIKSYGWSEYVYNGIDRKDSSIGYLLKNCLPCCGRCNRMKMASEYEEFLMHIKRIFSNRVEAQ
jgi:hypothetical protein